MAYGARAVSDEHGEDHAGRGRHLLAGDHGKAEAEAKAEAMAVMHRCMHRGVYTRGVCTQPKKLGACGLRLEA